MSISRVNGASWGAGDKLTSAQANSLDTNVTYALDKRSGQTDTLESVVTHTGSGRFIPTVTAGANADTTYSVGSGKMILRVTSSVTANRTYTLDATGVSTNDVIEIYCESSFAYKLTVKDQAAATMIVLGSTNDSQATWAKFIYISGWRLLESGKGSRIFSEEFTANGTWTAPPGVTRALIIGYGGGGGGGGGVQSTTDTNRRGTGGGGGGGSLQGTAVVTVTPGNSYNIVIGAGGTAGAAGLAGSNTAGGDGGDTTFDGTAAVFHGAQGGAPGVAATSSPDVGASVLGGQATSMSATALYQYGGWSVSTIRPFVFSGPAGGGCGRACADTTNSGGTAGADNPIGNSAGGSGSTCGADDGSYRGGGGGGGGGGGPGGNGAAGGAGGGTAAGTGTAGSAGSNASANTGAGGGGGGSGGHALGGGVAGGNGGTGGSGKLTVIWVM